MAPGSWASGPGKASSVEPVAAPANTPSSGSWLLYRRGVVSLSLSSGFFCLQFSAVSLLCVWVCISLGLSCWASAPFLNL